MKIGRNRAAIVHFRAVIVQSEDFMRYHPNHQMDLPISMNVYHQLLSAARDTGYQKEFWEIGEAAIRDWMVRHNPDSFSMTAVTGYQWKHVFLPNGTLLRTVEDDLIRYHGAEISPSGFVNAVGGTRRNARKTLWILFPDTSTWKLAGTLRTKRPAQRPRS
jgi:hypothetical protein